MGFLEYFPSINTIPGLFIYMFLGLCSAVIFATILANIFDLWGGKEDARIQKIIERRQQKEVEAQAILKKIS
ncbi:hypothetical protein pb186bvf_013137 [Paramecium bursaria]